MILAEEAEEGSERGREPRDFIVASETQTEFEYLPGVFSYEETPPCIAIVVVAEVDSRLLVAVPEAAWAKSKRKRMLPAGSFHKPVQVFVPLCDHDRRHEPDNTPTTKIWLGLLDPAFERHLSFEEGDQVEMGFPVDAQGVQRLPYARALVKIARDHFTFLSAESGVPAPPGLGAGDAELNQRMGLLEDGMAALQAGMQEILQAKLGRKPKAAARPKDNEKQFPPGVDPAVAAHALQVGVSPDALAEMAQLFQAAPKAAAEVEAEEVANSSEEEEAFLDPALGVAGGSQDPMVTAVSQMSKILKSMYKEKKVRKDKTLDSLLDRVDVGLGKEHGSGGTKTKAAALQALQQCLIKDPKLIYTAIEKRMMEDYVSSALPPGATSRPTTARGWVEHRSKIQSYPSSIRAVWTLSGVWDALIEGRIDEARARCALGVAQLDQQAYDAGGWILAAEMALEAPPPYSAFAVHQPPAIWEQPHTRLIDHRWVDLCMARLRDVADYHEKKIKLNNSSRAGKNDENGLLADPKPKSQPKGKKGGGKGKPTEEAGPPQNS